MLHRVTWSWHVADWGGGADGSAMSKLFRGGALSDTALLAREAIQNSSDAARRFQRAHPEVPFKVVFRFEHLFGEEKSRAVEALDLRGLRDRRLRYTKDPLQPRNALDELDNPDVSLNLLYVEDYGTHGLYGHPKYFDKSHLFKAMYFLGSSTKGADEGGSYGFGKSALERASRTHSVIAHSTFEPFEDDRVTTRLVGFTWWPNLQDGNTMYNGRASFAKIAHDSPQGPPEPFVNGEANEIALELGFRTRDPGRFEQLGSSFLIVDPTVEPDTLIQEVERWWWPALEEHRLDVHIILPTGEHLVPKPSANPFVAQFLKPYRIATGVDEPGDPKHDRLASREWRSRGVTKGKDLGTLALTVPEAVPDADDEELGASSLVALMRGPRMVIEYKDHGKRRVPIRGVYIASDEINPLLRETEPASHDRWATHSAGDVSAEATETAKTVLARIARSVAAMAKELAPPPPKTTQSLSHFSRLMKGFMGKKTGPGHPRGSGGEPIELQFPHGRPGPRIHDDSTLTIASTFTVRVADSAPRSRCQVRVDCHLNIYEDEGQSQDQVPVNIEPFGEHHGFVRQEDGSWSGSISKEEKVTFNVVSDPYPNLWTTSLHPTVVRTSDWEEE